MKKLTAIILSFVLLTGCAGGPAADSSSNSINENSQIVQPVPTPREEEAIGGNAPLLIKQLLYKLMTCSMMYNNWTSPDQLYATHLLDFYRYNEVRGNYDQLAQLYGTVIKNEWEYLAVPADVYEKYIHSCFGENTPDLTAVQEYDSEKDIYRIYSYISDAPSYDVTITGYTEDNGLLTVEYTTVNYDGKVHKRIMSAQQGENGWQYLSNGFDTTAPQTEPYPMTNMSKEKLPDHAMALAEQMVEFGPSGNYKLADIKPEYASRLFMTNFIFTFETSKNYNENYPYKNIVNRVEENSSKIIYPLNRTQMIAYQLYGFENWFVPSSDYDYATMFFTGETDVGWGFGPQTRDISAEYISDSRIRINIHAENPEAEKKYNFAVYFDVMTENECTFLRFNEMTMETL